MTDQPKDNLEQPIASTEQAKSGHSQPKDNLELTIERLKVIVELVKALAWPLFATIALLSFWGPLRLTVRQLPDLVSRSETITVAGLSIKVQRGFSQQASDEVKQAVAQLSPEGISRILTMQGNIYYDSNSVTYARTEYKELIDLGLVEPLPEEELLGVGSDDRQYGYGVGITPLGEEAQRLLIALISEFTQELDSSQTPK